MSGCVSRPINIQAGLIDCPKLLPKVLLAGPAATAVSTAGTETAGGLANFAQQTEAGRLHENRDKIAVNTFYVDCAAENARLTQKPKRRKVLGIF